MAAPRGILMRVASVWIPGTQVVMVMWSVCGVSTRVSYA